MAQDMGEKVGALEFTSPINMENSFTQWNVAKKAKSVMELYFYKDQHGFIEWCIDELDMVENIGLVFEFDKKGKRTLVDYDGIFALPKQAVKLLRKHGVVVGKDFIHD